MSRKPTVLLLCLALCCVLLPVLPASADAAPTPLPTLSPTPTVAPGFTGIYDETGLRAISQDPGGSYELMADIDLKDALWQPLEFSGILDGNGHTVFNVKIRETNPAHHTTIDGNHIHYDTLSAGLFSYASGATIRNLHLLNVDVRIAVDDHVFAAGLVGIADDTAISGCSVEGRIYVTTPRKMFGAGGLVGFGSGTIADCSTDVLTVIVDTNPAERSEAFQGGLLACGQSDIDRCTVKTTGYASLTGYMHTGGIVGMFHKSIHDDPTVHHILDCTVSATEYYYEDNPDPRRYCYPIYGEVPTSDTRLIARNAVLSFDKHQSPIVGIVLQPEKDAAPVYTSVVTPPTCTAFGYTTYTCSVCGYSYADDFTAPAHRPGPWTTVQEATYAAPGLAAVFCTVDGVLLQEEVLPQKTYETSLDLTYRSTRSLAALLPDGAPTAGIVWASTDERVVTVDADGNLRCVGPGAATVTASAPDGVVFATFGVGATLTWWQWLVKILLFGWIWY